MLVQLVELKTYIWSVVSFLSCFVSTPIFTDIFSFNFSSQVLYIFSCISKLQLLQLNLLFQLLYPTLCLDCQFFHLTVMKEENISKYSRNLMFMGHLSMKVIPRFSKWHLFDDFSAWNYLNSWRCKHRFTVVNFIARWCKIAYLCCILLISALWSILNSCHIACILNGKKKGWELWNINKLSGNIPWILLLVL